MNSIPADFQEIGIETAEGTVFITGQLLGRIDNERRGRPRWAEIKLYKYASTKPGNYGQQYYLLHTLGHSVVYHVHDSPCNRGIPVPVSEFPERAEFPEDLEPCEDALSRGRVTGRGCYPPDWKTLPPETLLDLEVTRHTVFDSLDAEGVLDQLRRAERKTCPACEGRQRIDGGPCQRCASRGFIFGNRTLSAPGQRLMEIVRPYDSELADAASQSVTL